MIVSVVIPVYNVKLYLERCVQSVLCQTYRDLEIILVDDGSTDGSGELCDTIAQRHKNIMVVHQENQGLSGARNSGIRKATGDYIIFIDSDDTWLLDDGIEQILQSMDNRTDMVAFKVVHIYGNHQSLTADYDLENIKKLSTAEDLFAHLVSTQQFNMSACPLIIRRQILIDNDVFFPIGIISEDVFWSMKLWQHLQKVKIINLNFYGYQHHEASMTTTVSIRVYKSYDKIFSYWKTQCDAGCKNANAIRIYMANMWVNRGYGYFNIKSFERPEALQILKKHADLLKYGITPKSRRVRKLVKLFGVKSTVEALGWYWRLRKHVR